MQGNKDNIGLITPRNCVTAFENENEKRIRDASQKTLQKLISLQKKLMSLQLISLQKKSIKSSTTYFPRAFSESKEPDISINKDKRNKFLIYKCSQENIFRHRQ